MLIIISVVGITIRYLPFWLLLEGKSLVACFSFSLSVVNLACFGYLIQLLLCYPYDVIFFEIYLITFSSY